MSSDKAGSIVGNAMDWSLNPFGTGQCLPTKTFKAYDARKGSQSLWNRAMSSDCTGVLEHCAARLARGTSQFFLTPSELAIDLFNF